MIAVAWTKEDSDLHGHRVVIFAVIPGLVKVIETLGVRLFNERQQVRKAACLGVADVGARGDQSRREATVGVFIGVQRQAQLLEIVGAACTARRFANLLDGGHQQRDEHGDDGQDRKKLDQRKGRWRPSHRVNSPRREREKTWVLALPTVIYRNAVNFSLRITKMACIYL